MAAVSILCVKVDRALRRSMAEDAAAGFSRNSTNSRHGRQKRSSAITDGEIRDLRFL